eukprot:TRINITY_DN8037_c0_g1_i1.p1 TRINITY_DN8037_c0_g1~~TRINITY_DN8037_c0_g1_i1.p1  ORF type:complete len:146 (-),score=43.69 TRINITY_DN8037_c0_g1_i1:153-590(-)
MNQGAGERSEGGGSGGGSEGGGGGVDKSGGDVVVVEVEVVRKSFNEEFMGKWLQMKYKYQFWVRKLLEHISEVIRLETSVASLAGLIQTREKIEVYDRLFHYKAIEELDRSDEEWLIDFNSLQKLQHAERVIESWLSYYKQQLIS